MVQRALALHKGGFLGLSDQTAAPGFSADKWTLASIAKHGVPWRPKDALELKDDVRQLGCVPFHAPCAVIGVCEIVQRLPSEYYSHPPIFDTQACAVHD